MDLTQLEMFNAVALTGSRINSSTPRSASSWRMRVVRFEGTRCTFCAAWVMLLRYSRQILALVDEARMVVAGDEPQGLFALGALESTGATAARRQRRRSGFPPVRHQSSSRTAR
jgi:hypothetical protein